MRKQSAATPANGRARGAPDRAPTEAATAWGLSSRQLAVLVEVAAGACYHNDLSEALAVFAVPLTVRQLGADLYERCFAPEPETTPRL